jgi:hypothetical protein
MDMVWCTGRYRDRYWKKDNFVALETLNALLTSTYGEGTVTPANAALRWMIHHSKLSSDYGGMIMRSFPLQNYSTLIAIYEMMIC